MAAGGFKASRLGRPKINDAALSRTAQLDADNAEETLVAQIDTMQKLSEWERKDILGDNFFTKARELYNLLPTPESALPFRPSLRLPYLQMLGISDTVDLATVEPRTYLIKPASDPDKRRDRARELYFRQHWREYDIAEQWFGSQMWAFLAGTGFLQVAWDSQAANGQGDAIVAWRDPESVYPDPYAYSDSGRRGWRYVIFEDWIWYDELLELWGRAARRVRPRFGSGDSVVPGTQQTRSGTGVGRSPFQYPAGPLRSIGGMPATSVAGDGRVRVRTVFVKDSAVSDDENEEPLFPKGRYIVESEGVILNPETEEQQNPYEHGEFPIVRVVGMPPLTSFWAPPPTRFSLSLQESAERWFAQIYENGVRVNNAMVFLDQNSGIEEDAFGGVPGEFHLINPQSRPPTFVWPQPMPPYMIQMPEMLLSMQDRIQGFNQERLGKAAAGNISAPQFEAAISQSSSITRMRAMYMFRSVRRLEYLRFMTMAQYYKEPRILPDSSPDDVGYVQWEPLNEQEIQTYRAVVDKASIQPMSETMLRMMVPLLGKIGWLDPQSGLEILGWPNVREVLKRLSEQAKEKAEMQMQMKQAGKGGRK